MRISDWSSDVCSSDLSDGRGNPVEQLYRLFIRRIILYIVSIGSAMTAFLASEGSRRQRKRAQTANHLSATAFRLFETHGYDVVAMEQIAAEADVAKATLDRKSTRLNSSH